MMNFQLNQGRSYRQVEVRHAACQIIHVLCIHNAYSVVPTGEVTQAQVLNQK